MTSITRPPCTVLDGETHAEHLARTGCDVSTEGWQQVQEAIHAGPGWNNDALGDPTWTPNDAEHVPAGLPDEPDPAQLAAQIQDAHQAVEDALNDLARLLHDVQASDPRDFPAVATMSFTGYALTRRGLDIDILLHRAADVRAQLVDLLDTAGNVVPGECGTECEDGDCVWLPADPDSRS